MPKLYVYLYENGTKESFANLSGQELQSLEDATSGYGDLDTDGEYEYATIEVSEKDAAKLGGKKVAMKPQSYGSHKWGNVQLEFLTTATGGRRHRRKTRKTKKSKKSRKTRKL